MASSQQRFAEPGQTLIFFDWDDTLFPTSALFERWNLPKRAGRWPRVLPPALERELQPWRDAVYQYLSVAAGLSDRCVIITNATSPWVESCISHFAPLLKPLLERSSALRVVYAGDVFRSRGDTLENIDAGALTKAKLAAMQQEAEAFYSRYPAQTWKNVLSLGDMRYEREAVHQLATQRLSSHRERLRTKALLLPTKPSLSEITLRLRFSRLLLPAYIHFDGCFDLDLRSAADPLQEIANALGIPQLGALPFPRHAWGRTPVPDEELAAEALDEVAVTVHESVFDFGGGSDPVPVPANPNEATPPSESPRAVLEQYQYQSPSKRAPSRFLRQVSDGLYRPLRGDGPIITPFTSHMFEGALASTASFTATWAVKGVYSDAEDVLGLIRATCATVTALGAAWYSWGAHSGAASAPKTSDVEEFAWATAAGEAGWLIADLCRALLVHFLNLVPGQEHLQRPARRAARLAAFFLLLRLLSRSPRQSVPQPEHRRLLVTTRILAVALLVMELPRWPFKFIPPEMQSLLPPGSLWATAVVIHSAVTGSLWRLFKDFEAPDVLWLVLLQGAVTAPTLIQGLCYAFQSLTQG